MDLPEAGNVTILCSGFGLGFYIPGLLIGEKLRRLGIRTEVEVFESLLPVEKIQMVEKNRQAYHQSFRLASPPRRCPATPGKAWTRGGGLTARALAESGLPALHLPFWSLGACLGSVSRS